VATLIGVENWPKLRRREKGKIHVKWAKRRKNRKIGKNLGVLGLLMGEKVVGNERGLALHKKG
jgi:hypothetical protein